MLEVTWGVNRVYLYRAEF